MFVELLGETSAGGTPVLHTVEDKGPIGGCTVTEDDEVMAGVRAAPPERWDELWAAVDALLREPEWVTWVPAQKQPDGVTVMGWPEYSPALEATHTALGRVGAITPAFDWPAWINARHDPGGVGLRTGPAADAVRYLTAVIPSERFGDGNLDAAMRDGALPAALAASAAGTTTSGPGKRGDRSADAVVEVHHAVAEAAFVEELELQPDTVRKSTPATSHHDRRDEEAALVDQSRAESLGCQLWAAHGDVALRSGLRLPDGYRVELPLEPGPLAGNSFERSRVHDLVGRLPHLGVGALDRELVGEGVRRLPVDHRLVHPAPVESGSDRAFEVVDERMHLLVGRPPAEVALLVGDVAVERHDGGDQLAHASRRRRRAG